MGIRGSIAGLTPRRWLWEEDLLHYLPFISTLLKREKRLGMQVEVYGSPTADLEVENADEGFHLSSDSRNVLWCICCFPVSVEGLKASTHPKSRISSHTPAGTKSVNLK